MLCAATHLVAIRATAFSVLSVTKKYSMLVLHLCAKVHRRVIFDTTDTIVIYVITVRLINTSRMDHHPAHKLAWSITAQQTILPIFYTFAFLVSHLLPPQLVLPDIFQHSHITNS